VEDVERPAEVLLWEELGGRLDEEVVCKLIPDEEVVCKLVLDVAG